jgi:hypothetical protein
VAEHEISLPRPRQVEDTKTTEVARRVAVDLKLRDENLHEKAD